MAFAIKGKVAIITGGASGLGLSFGKELLQNGLRGLTIADINEEQGEKSLKELTNLFGGDKVIFQKTDVTDAKSFEEAFKNTVDKFKNIDILINSAGIMNDAIWEKEILININGTINGILLALENYIFKHKSGPVGVILNMSSIAAITPSQLMPIYTATKSAVLTATMGWGHESHFERTGVKVVALCPGVTKTPLWDDVMDHFIGDTYIELFKKTMARAGRLPSQTSELVAQGMMAVIERAPSGTAWICEAGEKPFQYCLPDRLTMEKKFL